jgi:hypothetical protein
MDNPPGVWLIPHLYMRSNFEVVELLTSELVGRQEVEGIRWEETRLVNCLRVFLMSYLIVSVYVTVEFAMKL